MGTMKHLGKLVGEMYALDPKLSKSKIYEEIFKIRGYLNDLRNAPDRYSPKPITFEGEKVVEVRAPYITQTLGQKGAGDFRYIFKDGYLKYIAIHRTNASGLKKYA